MNYLKNRGIDVEPDWPADVGNPYMLGLVVDPDPGHEIFTGRLAIPYQVPIGDPVGMKFRCMGNHDCGDMDHAKYLAHEGMGQRLYNVGALRTDATVVAITEGELDAVVAGEAGLPAVACPGVNGWKPEWAYLFEGFDQVIVFGDGDPAGRKFAQRVAGDLDNGRSLIMPDGEDISSYIVKHGAEDFREKVGF